MPPTSAHGLEQNFWFLNVVIGWPLRRVNALPQCWHCFSRSPPVHRGWLSPVWCSRCQSALHAIEQNLVCLSAGRTNLSLPHWIHLTSTGKANSYWPILLHSTPMAQLFRRDVRDDIGKVFTDHFVRVIARDCVCNESHLVTPFRLDHFCDDSSRVLDAAGFSQSLFGSCHFRHGARSEVLAT